MSAAADSMQGAVGAFGFGEAIGPQWLCGAALILLGVLLVSAGRLPHAEVTPPGSSAAHRD